MNILCLNKISKVGLANLTKDSNIVEDINDADAILVRSANMLEMSLPSRIKCVARAGAGVNNIPLERYAKEGIAVFNTPGANANAVKELTIAAMLLAARDIKASMKWVDDNKDDELINKSMEKAKSSFAGNELFGKTLGIIGLGAIGALVANAAGYLGMHVIASEPSDATIERNSHLLPKNFERVSYDELYSRSDYISLHVPLLEATRGMINEVAFSKMKKGVNIINCARDAIVNDDDLSKAIDEGIVHRYVTDFPNHKTANMKNVIAISHLGASTEEAEDNCAVMAVNQTNDYIYNGNIINSVNFPRIDLGRKEDIRLLVLYVGDKAEEIMSIVSKHTTVKKMTSGVKGSFGASLFEIDDEFDLSSLNNLVIKSRLIK